MRMPAKAAFCVSQSTDRLGPKFLGLVPYFIPLGWFMMMYCAWVLAGELVRAVAPVAGPVGPDDEHERWGWKWRALHAATAALAVTAWDLMADPMMVRSGHWVWEQPGAYSGIPVQNYAGWLVTALCIYLPFAWTGGRLPLRPRGRTPRWFDALPIWAYAITWLTSVLSLAVVGLSGPAVAGFFGMGAWAVLGLVQTGTGRSKR